MQVQRIANRDFLAETAAGLLLVAALLFGGGSRGVGDLVVHLCAVPAVLLAVLRWRHDQISGAQRAFLYLLLATLTLAALQLVPLPAAWIARLPQRAGVLADLERAGAATSGWHSLSVDRWGTWRALLALATFTASWALLVTLPWRARVRLLQWVLLVAAATALLGFAQAAAGSHSALRFYDYHHPVGAIGLFANRNHFADLMALLLPLAMALGLLALATRQWPRALAWYALAAVLFLAAALSFSRTGLVLACITALASLAWLPSRLSSKDPTGLRPQRLIRWAPVAAIAVALIGIVVYAWDGIDQRLQQDPLQDLRWQYVQYGWQAVQAWLPLGSGLGSFREVYAPFEPVAAMQAVHALHAHNDLLEVALEAGVPGLGLVLTLCVMLFASRRKSHIDHVSPGPILAGAALAATVPLVHSLIDYPLRTLAVALAVSLAWSLLLKDGGHAQ